MAQRQKNKRPKVAEAESPKSAPEPSEVAEDALARVPDDEAQAGAEDDDEESAAKAEGGEEASAGGDEDGEQEGAQEADEQTAADAEEEVEEEEGDAPAAGDLGKERYVLAGFFAAGMLAAYVLGRAIQTMWTSASNKDWFSQTFPRLAAVPDEDKGTYGLILGGVLALVLVLRTYRRPDIRTWTDEVASELAKVKWPNRKEVSNSTLIVIAASTLATLYLALLDRLWAFVTNIVYGDGS